MFNWLTVLVLLPVEIITGYLYRVSGAIIDATTISGGQSEQKFLGVLTDPFTDLIIQVRESMPQNTTAVCHYVMPDVRANLCEIVSLKILYT